ncbi:MAG TPA: efflux RND transporter permease subunit [Tepidisphaeraceae bacterium]|nr:efflux RND transporter permease subunit [Tepidisphaeraceae bacterium]
MKIASWAQTHARSILFLLSALTAAGAASALYLPVGLFPDVQFPRVQVGLDAGDRPAERMAVEVTYPVEEALRSIPGVRSIRSTTSRGSADISINFDWGQDMVSAMLQAESRINRVLSTLPAGTTFDVRRMDPTVFPVMAYSLTSDSRSLVQLRDLATYDLRPSLSAVSGVAQVEVQGGRVEEYRVTLNPATLRAYGITLADVADKLQANNVLTAVGRLEDHDKLYLAVSDTRINDLKEIGQTILRTGVNGPVRLKDVAAIRDDVAPEYTRVTADGHSAVLMQVYQQPGGNTVQIAKDIRAKFAQLSEQLPMLKDHSIKVAQWYDQSDLIIASASSVRDAVLIGVGLAAVVLLLFLRNWKITLIATLAVPATLAVTILLLYSLGMSFNIMTLGGMAAAVGLIIDDSIVMVEHIIRRLKSETGTPRQRVLLAAGEFTRPLFGSSASTIIIFVPLAFLSGVTGAFFKALSLTMAVALLVSFFVAWLAVPVLAARWLSHADTHEGEAGVITRTVHGGYQRFMQWLLHRPWTIALVIAPLLLGGYFAYQNVASGFMPSMDEGGFILDYIAPPGTSLTETDRMLRQVEAILQSIPDVQTYSRRTGLQLGGGLTEANTGDFFVRLKPPPRRDIDQVMSEVRERVEHTVPGLQIETAQLMEDLIGDLTSVPQPIEIKIFSDDPKTLADVAHRVADAIGKVPGVVEVDPGIVLAGDALNIKVDRVKAALEGVDPDDVTKAVTDELTGNVATQLQYGPKLVGVRVWLPQESRKTALDVENLPINGANGHVFPLKRVATVSTIIGQPEIDRENLKRMVAVTARIEGRDLGSTVSDVKKTLSDPSLWPPGIGYELGGLYEQQQIAFRGLLIVIIVAVLLVFLLLLFLYEQFIVALAMLAMPLLALCAVFIGLWATGTEMNVTSIMGMTMIVGIVTEVAIFYYSEYAETPADENPHSHQRMIAAGKHRMRAIAMTTIAAILALMPLALGIGQGSAMQQPLAIAIITGLVVQLPLVLIVLPALLVLFRRDRKPADAGT